MATRQHDAAALAAPPNDVVTHVAHVLGPAGMHPADATLLRDGRWERWAVDATVCDPDAACPQEGYLAPALPLEFHCHGLGDLDFSDFRALDLARVDATAQREGILCVLTVFLPREAFADYAGFVERFDAYRQANPASHLVGLGLEGPLLASVGGTPEQGSWIPTEAQWRELASWGARGLKYVVLSPDAYLPGSNLVELAPAEAARAPSIAWIAEILLAHDVLPALGHFQRSDPAASVAAVEEVLAVAARHGRRVLTDHLFNDMPLSFRHAWRTPSERMDRNERALQRELNNWNVDNLEEKLGAVPAALVQAGRAGKLVLCVNFDGDHVDHAVCRRLLEIVPGAPIIAMTDRIETGTLAGASIQRNPMNSLWYCDDGETVAAGSTSIDRTMLHLRALGLSEREIWRMSSVLAADVLGLPVRSPSDGPLDPEGCSFVDGDGRRGPLGRRGAAAPGVPDVGSEAHAPR